MTAESATNILHSQLKIFLTKSNKRSVFNGVVWKAQIYLDR